MSGGELHETSLNKTGSSSLLAKTAARIDLDCEQRLHKNSSLHPKTPQAKRRSQFTEKSLTIEELQRLHENLHLGNYLEPTNEQPPYRPNLTRAVARSQMGRRMEQARESSRLCMDAFRSQRAVVFTQAHDEEIEDCSRVSVSDMYPQMEASKSMKDISKSYIFGDQL